MGTVLNLFINLWENWLIYDVTSLNLYISHYGGNNTEYSMETTKLRIKVCEF